MNDIQPRSPLHAILNRVVAAAGLAAPDGRPLLGYFTEANAFADLDRIVRRRLASGLLNGEIAAAGFVLWAAYRLRASFPGGQLTWDYIHDKPCSPAETTSARDLVELGLRWWRRQARRSETGRNLYLYSLMAEGGLPDAVFV